MHCVAPREVMSWSCAVHEVTGGPLQYPPQDTCVTLSRLLVSLRKYMSPHRSSREGANQFCLNPYLDTEKSPTCERRQKTARRSRLMPVSGLVAGSGDSIGGRCVCYGFELSHHRNRLRLTTSDSQLWRLTNSMNTVARRVRVARCSHQHQAHSTSGSDEPFLHLILSDELQVTHHSTLITTCRAAPHCRNPVDCCMHMRPLRHAFRTPLP
ncbi:hypothetical protein TGRUB_358030 [Toxoplasma gondii RUB]|uniref:Uncharacterized protein n=2 Tax=Toxoplasma gondii TaxID=5811 RepID=A0A086LJ44_TOXGO|nr:hypothetical protein TGRUB_358030 [Toxoplasma gondii RUB]KFH00339.1 hypothetical protein TGMAS_358030 [Toxoplasma gondii MAS]